MTHSPMQQARLGRLVLAGAALVMPLCAAPGQDKAPAPAEPQIRREVRVMIVDKQADAKGKEGEAQTRVIEQDGKTVIITTDKAMNRPDLEAKIAEALAAHPDAQSAADGTQRRVIVKRIAPEGAPHDMAMIGEGQPDRAMTCPGGGKSTLIESNEKGADGEPLKLVIRLCSPGVPSAKAGEGLKAARERIAKDANLSPAIRDDILKQLDAEIERLSKQG
ncbi:MAG: hypothetical protein RL519_2079 [Pseudomonadota bacterium]